MKLSTKGRYGLRAMLEIAAHMGYGPLAMHIIAEKQGISERYLEQLLIPLKRTGMIKSVRGSQGGYILKRAPEDITVGDIIRVLEGPIAPVDCVSELDPEACSRWELCVTRKIWTEVRDSVSSVLDSYTLADLVQESRKL
ncbi:RrF2 family transcriptional regulator [Candidatus Contubernalis alkaliaceticus]|uniref:RrF2 family transcriptional regulator n=1 Tax=Candidatus Contubernalis alkaliaceticus TaxID=338645 RepID=UPI001F4BF081|nr:Rrf2 family transcriptional regulator [Candidatus Contubernalis alkalaceticus]UNC91386.1 Rrf2 family transcriptional regulator [Candidatus Contubernalis alkalaceticus]